MSSDQHRKDVKRHLKLLSAFAGAASIPKEVRTPLVKITHKALRAAVLYNTMTSGQEVNVIVVVVGKHDTISTDSALVDIIRDVAARLEVECVFVEDGGYVRFASTDTGVESEAGLL